LEYDWADVRQVFFFPVFSGLVLRRSVGNAGGILGRNSLKVSLPRYEKGSRFRECHERYSRSVPPLKVHGKKVKWRKFTGYFSIYFKFV